MFIGGTECVVRLQSSPYRSNALRNSSSCTTEAWTFPTHSPEEWWALLLCLRIRERNGLLLHGRLVLSLMPCDCKPRTSGPAYQRPLEPPQGSTSVLVAGKVHNCRLTLRQKFHSARPMLTRLAHIPIACKRFPQVLGVHSLWVNVLHPEREGWLSGRSHGALRTKQHEKTTDSADGYRRGSRSRPARCIRTNGGERPGVPRSGPLGSPPLWARH